MASSLRLPSVSSLACPNCGQTVAVSVGDDIVVCPHCEQRIEVESHGLTANRGTTNHEGDPSSAIPRDESVLDSDESKVGHIHVPSSIKAPDFREWGAVAEETGSVEGSSTRIANPDATEGRSFPPSVTGGPSGGLVQGPEKTEPRKGDLGPNSPRQEQVPTGVKGVSRRAFWALLIYASIVTAICLGLLLLVFTNRAHQLESLPDVVPPKDAQGEIARQLVPPDATLPDGHVLELGQTQRFGDVLVTPLKVTREPLGFVHYQGTQVREPAGEVLKLWLKFENVSSNKRAFAPLDGELLFYRVGQPGSGSFKANNFLASRESRSQDQFIAMFDHPLGSDWDLAEQSLGEVIPTGETLVSYVPTETGLPELTGPLVWRFQLRKGIAENGWGVTTLVEVAFSASEIQGS